MNRRSSRSLPHPSAVLRRWRWLLPVTALLVCALRVWASLDARYPRVVADEVAYLGMARLLAGGEPWNLGLASTYGPGYAVLLTPWFALDLSPDAVYRAGVLTNVALAGATFWAFEALARRLPGVDRPLSIGLAGVAASLPALVATTALVWSDDLAPLVFALLLLAVAAVVDRPDPWRLTALGAVTVVGYSVHARFLPLAPVVLGLVGVLAVTRRVGVRAAVLTAAGTVGGLAAVHVGQGLIYDALYEPGQVTSGINEAHRITRVRPLLLSAAGQAWYLTVTTAGLAAAGAVAVGATWLRHLDRLRRDRSLDDFARSADDDGPSPLTTTVLVGFVAAAFVTSVVFMTDKPRGDHLVYGRYNDLFVGPLVVIGGAVLIRMRDRRRLLAGAAAVAAVVAGLAAVLWWRGQGRLEAGHLVFTVLGLVAVDPGGPAALRTATVIGGAAATAVLAAALLPGKARAIAVVAVSAALCVVGSVRAVDRIDPSPHVDIRGAAVIAEVLEDGDRLAWVTDDPEAPIASAFYRYQLYTPDNPSVRVAARPWERGEPFLMAGARNPGPVEAGYRLAWVDPGGPLGLWVAPGNRQDALAAEDRLLPVDPFEPPPGGDQGELTVVDGVTASGSPARLRATLDVTLDGGPHAGVGSGGDATGRIRVAVTVTERDCDQPVGDPVCTVHDARADLGRWVAADAGSVSVDVDLTVPDTVDPSTVEVTFQLIREGVERFGTAVTVEP